jgi:hypothetical protein
MAGILLQRRRVQLDRCWEEHSNNLSRSGDRAAWLALGWCFFSLGGDSMESRIWSKSEEKWAYILVLKGQEVNVLKVTGNMLTLKRNVQGVMEALQQGEPPASVGAKSVETLDARTISKAEVSPGNATLTLHGGADGSTELAYTTGDSDADAILKEILAQSGRTFQPAEEEIGVIEALIPPGIFGALAAIFWFAVYSSAGQMEAGEEVDVRPGRRAGLRWLLVWVAELLGTGGTIALGVVLLALILGWAAARIIRRPKRTVWLPEKA